MRGWRTDLGEDNWHRKAAEVLIRDETDEGEGEVFDVWWWNPRELNPYLREARYSTERVESLLQAARRMVARGQEPRFEIVVDDRSNHLD